MLSSLLSSKIDKGSINTVEPVLEISCTKPLIWALYSSFTGKTYLSFLIVTTFSCKYFEYVDECKMLFKDDFMFCSNFLWFLRIVFKVEDASSETVFSSSIDLKTLLYKSSFVYNILK